MGTDHSALYAAALGQMCPHTSPRLRCSVHHTDRDGSLTSTVRGPGTRQPALAIALVLGGLVLVVLAVVRLASDDEPSSEGGAAARETEPCVGQPCRANNDPSPVRGYEAPSVTVNPNDPEHIVVSDVNLVGGHCGWHVTFNGGRDWQDGVFQRPQGFRECRLGTGGFLPAGNVTFGPSGRVYAVFSLSPETAPENGSVLLAVSSDGGRTFAPASVVAPGGFQGLGFTRAQVTAASGQANQDRLFISFWGCERQPARCIKTLLVRSGDGGQSFSPPMLLLAQPVSEASPSRPVVGADGSVFLLFLRRVQGRDTELHLAKSTDGGATFSSTVVESQAVIGGTPSSVPYDSAKLTTSPDGRALYTVFSHQTAGNHQVFFRRSTNGGASWDEPVRINKSPTGDYYDPNISVAPNGRIDLVLYQRTGEKLDIVLYAYSTDGGARFSPDRRVNFIDKPIDRRIGYMDEVFDMYTPAAASTPERAVLVWSDTREGNNDTDTQDTFLRRLAPGEVDGAGT